MLTTHAQSSLFYAFYICFSTAEPKGRRKDVLRENVSKVFFNGYIPAREITDMEILDSLFIWGNS